MSFVYKVIKPWFRPSRWSRYFSDCKEAFSPLPSDTDETPKSKRSQILSVKDHYKIIKTTTTWYIDSWKTKSDPTTTSNSSTSTSSSSHLLPSTKQMKELEQVSTDITKSGYESLASRISEFRLELISQTIQSFIQGYREGRDADLPILNEIFPEKNDSTTTKK